MASDSFRAFDCLAIPTEILHTAAILEIFDSEANEVIYSLTVATEQPPRGRRGWTLPAERTIVATSKAGHRNAKLS